MALLVLAGCDPYGVPDNPKRAEIDVDVQPDGGAHVQMFLAAEHADELIEVAEDVGPVLFPSARTGAHIDHNDGGADFAEISVDDAYQRGSTAELRLDTSGLRDVLVPVGIERITLQLCAPVVPSTFRSDADPSWEDDDCAAWKMTSSSAPTDVTLAMRPEPRRWWFALGLIGVTIAGAALSAALLLAGWRSTSHRVAAFVCAAVGVVAGGVMVATDAAWQGDNLGVAGQLSGRALKLATDGLIVELPVFVLCLVLLPFAIWRPTVRSPWVGPPR